MPPEAPITTGLTGLVLTQATTLIDESAPSPIAVPTNAGSVAADLVSSSGIAANFVPTSDFATDLVPDPDIAAESGTHLPPKQAASDQIDTHFIDQQPTRQLTRDATDSVSFGENRTLISTRFSPSVPLRQTKGTAEPSANVDGVSGDNLQHVVIADAEPSSISNISPTVDLAPDVQTTQTVLPAVNKSLPAQIATQLSMTVGSFVVGMDSGDVVSIDADLRPPELGRVQIRLSKSDSGLEAFVLAEDELTHRIIATHTLTIENAVRSELSLDGSVNVQLGDQTMSRESSHERRDGTGQSHTSHHPHTQEPFNEAAPRARRKADVDVLA